MYTTYPPGSLLTFAALTGEGVVVVPGGLVPAHHTQLLTLDPAHVGGLPALLAHGGHGRCRLVHVGVAGDLQGALPQLVHPCRGEPLLSTVLGVVGVLARVVGRRGLPRLPRGVLHVGIAGEG